MKCFRNIAFSIDVRPATWTLPVEPLPSLETNSSTASILRPSPRFMPLPLTVSLSIHLLIRSSKCSNRSTICVLFWSTHLCMDLSHLSSTVVVDRSRFAAPVAVVPLLQDTVAAWHHPPQRYGAFLLTKDFPCHFFQRNDDAKHQN